MADAVRALDRYVQNGSFDHIIVHEHSVVDSQLFPTQEKPLLMSRYIEDGLELEFDFINSDPNRQRERGVAPADLLDDDLQLHRNLVCLFLFLFLFLYFFLCICLIV